MKRNTKHFMRNGVFLRVRSDGATFGVIGVRIRIENVIIPTVIDILRQDEDFQRFKCEPASLTLDRSSCEWLANKLEQHTELEK